MSDDTVREPLTPPHPPATAVRRADWFLWACGVLLAGWLVGLTVLPIWDPDVWFHLKLGQWVIDHHAVPHTNLFMYTTPTYRWIDHSWLSEVLFYLGFRGTGMVALPVLIALPVAASMAVLWRLWFRLEGRADLAPVAFGMALVAASTRFTLRPELFTLLGLSLLLTILYLYRGRSSRFLWTLPVLAVVWANLHGGWASGIVVMWAFVGAEALTLGTDRIRGRPADGIFLRRLAFWAMVATAATLINPYGYRWFEAVDPRRLRGLAQQIDEWRSITASVSIRSLGPALTAAYLAPLAVTAVVLMTAGRRASLTSVLLLLLAAAMGLTAVRNLGLAAWMCLPILAVASRAAADGWVGRTLSRWGRLGNGRGRIVYRVVVVAALAVGAVHLWINGMVPGRRPGLGVDMTLAPSGAVDFIEREGLRGPMFNMYQQGAYLVWRLFPRDKVFIDGLNAYPMTWFGEYRAVAGGETDPATVIARWRVNYFLLNEGDLSGYADPYRLINELRGLGWQLVYYNGRDMIYVSDSAPYRDVIARHAYRHLRPGEIDAATYRDHPTELRAEVGRMIASSPESPYAHDTAAWILYRLRDVAGAVREFEEEARVAPNSMPAYLGLGQLAADAGQDELAITHYRRAVRLAPRNASAHQALADGYEQGGRLREAAAERRRVVLLEPGSPVRRYELARTYRAQARQPGAPKERLLRAAVSELRIAFRLSPNPEIAYALGAVLLAGDQPREAIREFKRGIELDAAWPDSYRGLARAYEALDDRDAAIQAWRDFLTHRPDEDAAAQARARLRALESP